MSVPSHSAVNTPVERDFCVIGTEPFRSMSVAAGLSRSSFAARFKEKTGEAAMDYLTRWRMVLAADRLADHGMTIAAVAPMVGYDSESAFGAAFRRVVGSSPRQFANSTVAKPS